MWSTVGAAISEGSRDPRVTIDRFRPMMTFTDQELRLIRKLEGLDALAVLELREACPRHSACMPLPLFAVQKLNDDEFEATWNDHHVEGPRQRFRFSGVAGLRPAS